MKRAVITRLGRCGSRSLAAPVNRGGASSLQNRYNSSQCKPVAGRPESTRRYAAATDAGSNFAALRAMERGGSRCAAGLRRNSYPFCQHRVCDGSRPFSDIRPGWRDYSCSSVAGNSAAA